ncbi:hypothetical protein FMM78_14540 [Bacteroides caecimuris]|nr:hypothetical protein [Bacteroides caecimuris]
MIISAKIRVLFECSNHTILKNKNSPRIILFLSLVFIGNHTIKYDIEKCAKYDLNDTKYQKLYIVLRKIVRNNIV